MILSEVNIKDNLFFSLASKVNFEAFCFSVKYNSSSFVPFTPDDPTEYPINLTQKHKGGILMPDGATGSYFDV